MNLEYLNRALSQKVADLRGSCAAALDKIMRENAAAGRLASGASLKMFTDESLSAFERAYIDAQQLAFNYLGHVDEPTVELLHRSASEMTAAVLDEANERAQRLGIHGDIVPNQVNVLRHRLEDTRKRLADDFRHGMRGSERLKKEPTVSIVASQTNSPGGIQQVGVGDFSQSAMAQNHQQLMQAIHNALSSTEFAALPAEKQHEFKDAADALVDEVAKPKPDGGKVKRWGVRLGEMALQLGMRVASDEIIHMIGKIFGA